MKYARTYFSVFSNRRKSVTLFSSVALYALVLLASFSQAQADEEISVVYDGVAIMESAQENYDIVVTSDWTPIETIMTEGAKAVETEEEAPHYALTDEERILIQKIVSREAGGIEGMGAVAQVILNRIKSERFPNTVYEVIFQKGQFTTAENVEYATIKEGAAEAVSRVFDDGETFVSDVPLYFCSQYSSHRGLTYIETVGGNKFYKY